MDFLNAPYPPSYQQQLQQYQNYQESHSYMQQPIQQPVYNEPKETITTSGGVGFNIPIISDGAEPPENLLMYKESSDVEDESKKKKRKKKSKLVEDKIETGMITTEPISSDDDDKTAKPTIYSYGRTTALLDNTLGQLDMVACELKSEMDKVRISRTIKGKYTYLVGLSNSLSQLLSTKTAVIKEINNAITKSNELDYRIIKDKRDSEKMANDDKYIMDMYNAFIQNPMGMQGSTQQILGVPDTLSVVTGTTDVFAPTNSKAQQIEEVGYQNYIKNLTPAENMMAYENDPNVKECVVYDAATGAKQFAIMNMATGQPVPNTEPLNTEVFMPDTTIDLANKIARNRNLNRTFPLIVLNDNNDVMSKY